MTFEEAVAIRHAQLRGQPVDPVRLQMAIERIQAGGEQEEGGAPVRVIHWSHAHGNPWRLTQEQLELLDLLAAGMDQAQVGARAGMARSTVAHQLIAIRSAMGAATTTQAVVMWDRFKQAQGEKHVSS